jgi:hypothetical protein
MLRMSLAVLYLDSNRPHEAIGSRPKKRCTSRPTTPALTSHWGAAISPGRRGEGGDRSMRRRPSLTRKMAKLISPWAKCACSNAARQQRKKRCATPSSSRPTWGPPMPRWRRFSWEEGKNSEARGLLEKAVASEFRGLAEPVRACGAAESSRRDGARNRTAPEGPAS